jgi:hypothetical protein
MARIARAPPSGAPPTRAAFSTFYRTASVRNWQILLRKSSSTLLHIRCNATDRVLVLIRLLRGIAFLKERIELNSISLLAVQQQGERSMLRCLLWALAAPVQPKALLIADNLCLRHQLLVLQRRKPRP